MENEFEKRRKALIALVARLGRGGIAKLARELEKSPTYISRMISSPDTNQHRPVTAETMLLIDARFPGWNSPKTSNYQSDVSPLSYSVREPEPVHLLSVMHDVMAVPLYKWSELKQVNSSMKEDRQRETIPVSKRKALSNAFAVEIETSPFPSRIPSNSTIVVNRSDQWITGKIAVVEIQRNCRAASSSAAAAS